MSKDSIKIYKSLDEIKDNRQFVFGCIWKVRDNLIKIPNIDRLNKRTLHFTRCVVIIDNVKENFDENSLLISIAPISHQVNCKRKFDIDLSKENDGVLQDSILMLDYIQPVLKKDLYECVGEISEDKKYELYEHINYKFGMNINSEEKETKEQTAAVDKTK